MTIRFLEPAAAELAEAIARYNAETDGLGYEFAVEVQATLGRITRFPEAWSMLSARTRRCRTRRFPYAVIYQVQENGIILVAIMHLRRHPDSWRGRTASQP
ncbi:MAG: type II toxin-antitoxin system RelE/ParE family toxin [Clostridia bacterium]